MPKGMTQHLSLHGRRFKQFCGALLLSSASVLAIGSLYNLQPDNFAKSEVIINNDTIAISDFYANLKYDVKHKNWVYFNQEGKAFKVDSLSDYRIKDEQNYKSVLNQGYQVAIDTVKVRYPGKSQPKQSPVFQLGALDSLKNLPAMGSQSWGKVRIRQFVVDASLEPDRQKRLQKIWDTYNDSLNCTEAHENQHRLNEIYGIMRAGQSFDNKFVECCLDEITANIRQLLAQRNNYLERGRNIEQITPRFAFYADLIRNGTLKPYPGIYTKKEISLIGNGIFDAWMKEKFDVYALKNANRTQNILFKTNANGIKADPEKHEKLLKQMFQIQGIDFYEVLQPRFSEVKVPEKTKENFRAIEKARAFKMTYLDKLEELRLKEGQSAVNNHLLRNKFIYSIKKSRS